MVSCLFVLATAAVAAVAAADSAPVLTDSPTNIVYTANFNQTSGVKGFVSFMSLNGTVSVDVNLTGFPANGGPFMYHVHERPVPTNGNCSGTLGHLNSYNGFETAPTDDTKEVGDLSGKHGMMEGPVYNATYIERYLSLNPSNPAFVGGLSVVVHLHNGTRIACANITARLRVVEVLGANRLLSHVALPMFAGAAAALL
ncbi:Cu,Zn superoxide dismutase-like protein [Metschnikowia bicuspidata]|uniref:superoxide dismutase n=1 Tax=Metschnikowia bicuspidata TaxID=27322 RepID=A0A4P9ZK41_9ASCO|nr:Cu,Zn superoxide dismutase-like protein [Metschnikowia bicuspidata]